MMAEDGMSPVHAAAQAGHVPCLAFLISMGMYVQCAETPLILKISPCIQEILKCLFNSAIIAIFK